MTPAFDYSHRQLLEFEPTVWPLVYTKHYEPPAGYASPKLPATIFGIALCHLKHPELTGGREVTSNNITLSAVLAKKYDFPTFYVSRELAEAVMATDPPKGTWKTVPFPYPCLTFMLPDNIIRDKELGTIRSLSITRADVGSYFFPGLAVPGVTVKDYPRIIVTTGFPCCQRKEMVIEGSVFPDTEPLRVSEEFFDRPMMIPDGYVREDFSRDADFASNCTALASRLLLAMAARPELVEQGQRTKHKLKSGTPVWTPNFIGRKYHVHRHASVSGDGGGWHVRMHWRRGHFRQQACGVGMKDHKTVWLEPMLIGAKEEPAANAVGK